MSTGLRNERGRQVQAGEKSERRCPGENGVTGIPAMHRLGGEGKRYVAQRSIKMSACVEIGGRAGRRAHLTVIMRGLMLRRFTVRLRQLHPLHAAGRTNLDPAGLARRAKSRPRRHHHLHQQDGNQATGHQAMESVARRHKHDFIIRQPRPGRSADGKKTGAIGKNCCLKKQQIRGGQAR